MAAAVTRKHANVTGIFLPEPAQFVQIGCACLALHSAARQEKRAFVHGVVYHME